MGSPGIRRISQGGRHGEQGVRLLDALDHLPPEDMHDEMAAFVVEDGGGVNETKPIARARPSPSDAGRSGAGSSRADRMSPRERWETAGELRSEAAREFAAGNRGRSREPLERAASLGDEKDAAALVDEKKREMWEMSPKRRLEKASELKEEGTKEFAAGNHAAAAVIYKKAAGFVDALQNGDEKGIFVKCHVNAAMCHVKAEEWPQVIYCCNEALYGVPEEANTNAKALYRRGVAKMHTGELKGARADLLAAYRIDSKERAVIQAIQELKARSAEEAEAKKKRKEKEAEAERKRRAQLKNIGEIDVYGDGGRDNATSGLDVIKAGKDGAFDSGPPASEVTGEEEGDDLIDVSIAEDGGGVNTKSINEARSDRQKEDKQLWEMSLEERRERARKLRAEGTNEFRAGNHRRSKELYKRAAAFVGEKNKHMWELTPEERLIKASGFKEQGSEDFAAGDLAAAADVYKRGAGLVGTCQSHTEKDVFVKCYLNAAVSHMKMKDWYQVISCCDEVFEKVPAEIETNAKALYGRGLARMRTGDLKGAKSDLMAAREIDGKNRDVRRAIQELGKKSKEAKEKDKARFGRMFGGNGAVAYDGKRGAPGLVVAEREAKTFGSAQEYLDSLLEKQ